MFWRWRRGRVKQRSGPFTIRNIFTDTDYRICFLSLFTASLLHASFMNKSPQRVFYDCVFLLFFHTCDGPRKTLAQTSPSKLFLPAITSLLDYLRPPPNGAIEPLELLCFSPKYSSTTPSLVPLISPFGALLSGIMLWICDSDKLRQVSQGSGYLVCIPIKQRLDMKALLSVCCTPISHRRNSGKEVEGPNRQRQGHDAGFGCCGAVGL